MADSLAVAETFFTALEQFDAATALACCADGCTFTRADVGVEQQMSDQLGQLLQGLQAAGGQIRYLEPQRAATPGGFVEEHIVEVTLFGKVIALPTAVIAEVGDDGRISAMREYLNPAPLDQLAPPAAGTG